jgi:hypothetical protein
MYRRLPDGPPPGTPSALIAALAVLAAALPVRAADAGTGFFEKKVRPVLVQHCYRCHSTEANKHKGGLELDSRDGLRIGGDSGPALVPGKPDESLLIKAVRYTDEGLRMPPKGRLPASVVADLEKWVTLGAPDPRSNGTAEVEKKADDPQAGREFWAFRPPRRNPVPAVKDEAWPRGPIDRFILARLEAKDLRPAAGADRATLLRRAYFDLIGLPPAPEEVEAFRADRSPDAFARVVDRLLASPHFGERWGRHWLDVARFAESSGGGRSLLLKDAWRYRDYVIASFNADVPYDRFVTEQVAGDLLPHATPEQRRRQLVATAFLALGPTNYERQDKDVLEMDVVDEQLDTMGRAFLGLTIGCARCHDHKFDPIPTRDYYALAGILHSTRTLIHDNVSRWVEQPLPVSPEQEAALKRHEAAAAALQEKIKRAKRKDPGKTPADAKDLEQQLKQLLATGPSRPVAMSVAEADRIEDCRVCIRGNTHNRGEKVPRGFLQAATRGRPPVIPAAESGRRQLAEWLASPENPLTARVMANRVWHHLFGAGLVRTGDNFGSIGETPSHPELLDYLALEFIASGSQDSPGWSVKRLIREIMLSRTYQLGGTPGTGGVDPENRLLGRSNRRRLDAEALRDTMLVVSGRLDRTMGGPTIKKGTVTETGYRFDDRRRSVYTPVFRNRLLELFEAFDFPDPNIVVGRRNVSTVAPQALYLMNSPFVLEESRYAARALLAARELDDAGRVDRAYRLALGRPPAGRERRLALDFVAEVGETATADERLAVWARFYQALFGCIDFRYVN